MKTLDQVVRLARCGEHVTRDELRCAVAAFDVLVHRLNIVHNGEQLKEYFIAAETPLDDYLGEANNPYIEEAQNWYKTMRAASDALADCPDPADGDATS